MGKVSASDSQLKGFAVWPGDHSQVLSLAGPVQPPLSKTETRSLPASVVFYAHSPIRDWVSQENRTHTTREGIPYLSSERTMEQRGQMVCEATQR